MSFISRTKQYKVPIGMVFSVWAPIVSEPDAAFPTYGDVEEIGAARLGTLTYTTAVVEIEGDDQVLRRIEQFQSGTLVHETTYNDLLVNAKIYGHRVEAGVVYSNKDDIAPPAGDGFIEPILLKDSNTPVYRATFLPKLTANQANEAQNAATRQGGTINPSYNSITYSVYACNTGDFRLQAEFSTEAAAKQWLLGMLGATETCLVDTTIVGNGTVEPGASHFFEAGEDAVLTFSSAPVALYDNGVNKTSSVANKEYTISNIAAPHHLVVVFAAS